MFSNVDAAFQKRIDGFTIPTFLPYVVSAFGAIMACLIPGVATLTGDDTSLFSVALGLASILIWAYATGSLLFKRVLLATSYGTFSRPWLILLGMLNMVVNPTVIGVMVGVGLVMLVLAAYMWKSNNRKEV